MKRKLLILIFAIVGLLCGCNHKAIILNSHMLSIIVDIVTINNDSILTKTSKDYDDIENGSEILLVFKDSNDLNIGIEKLELEEGKRIRVLYHKIEIINDVKTITISNFDSNIDIAHVD